MKKYYILLLLFYAGFSLVAQTNSKIFIFFPSITGVSCNPDDNRAIVGMLTNEISLRGYVLTSSPQGADFLLYGTVAPYYDDLDHNGRYFQDVPANITYFFNGLPEDTQEPQYIFNLTLKDIKANEVIHQTIVYTSFDAVLNFFPVVTYNLFTHIAGPQQQSDADSGWLNKWLYAGIGAFWSPRIYSGIEQSVHLVNFGGGVSVELLFLKFLSFETGAEIVTDWVAYSAEDNYQNLMLEIPLALKLVIKLSDHYMLGPYGGIHINIPLLETTKPPLLSWMAGIMGGFRAGPGMFFIEPRVSMDLGSSSLNTEQDVTQNVTPLDYQRFITHIGIGYKFGIFTKR